MIFTEKLDYLMEQNSLNKLRLSKECGIPYTTIDSLYKKGYENMKLPTFKILCDFFGVTMESMAYDDMDIVHKPAAGSSSSEVASDHDAELLRRYRELDQEGRERVDLNLNFEYDRCSEKREGDLYA